MKKENIVQFISFVTKLGFDDFVPAWDQFAKPFQRSAGGIHLFEAEQSTTNRFRYISVLDNKSADFRFAFMKGRNSEHFPEHQVKVVQLGGYIQINDQPAARIPKNNSRIMAFLDQGNYDLDFCKNLSCTHLNIYEAYYENCACSAIVEFFASPAETPELLQQLASRGGIHSATYRTCPVQVPG